MSEMDTCRELLAPYCHGTVLDLGHGGGRPIVDNAICIDREPNHPQRAKCGAWPTHICGDVANLVWFKDGTIDTVASSHVLEDFADTTAVLREWLRVLRPGGTLVLFLPDQRAYVAHCERHHALPNQAHQHADFSLAFVREKLAAVPLAHEVLTSIFPFPGNEYSFAIVIRKL